jgi:hypothetical protein
MAVIVVITVDNKRFGSVAKFPKGSGIVFGHMGRNLMGRSNCYCYGQKHYQEHYDASARSRSDQGPVLHLKTHTAACHIP